MRRAAIGSLNSPPSVWPRTALTITARIGLEPVGWRRMLDSKTGALESSQRPHREPGDWMREAADQAQHVMVRDGVRGA